MTADIVERLVIRLAAKKALSAPYEWEDEEYLNSSVIEMRVVPHGSAGGTA